MKKLALFLVMALLAMALVPAALAEDPMVVAWWGNQTRNERTQAILDMYAAENEGVSFDPQFVAWADYWNKLATAAAGHTLPDVVQMDYQYLNQYVGSSLLVDLKPYVDSGVLDLSAVNAGIIQAGTSGEGIYAVCNGVNAPSLLYNKTLLDENGITVKDNMTMDEFIALCREVYEKTGYKTNIGYGTDTIFDYVLRGHGKTMFADGKLAVSAEDAVLYFGLYEQGIKEGWHVGSEVFAETTIGTVEQDPMIYGFDPSTMSWCAFFWSNQMTAMQNAAPEGMEIGITTWPSADPVKSNYLKPSQFFSVTVDAKNPEASVKLIDYITNSVACNEVLLGERGIPASSIVADAIAPLMDENNQKVIDFINNIVSPNSSDVPAPNPDGSSEVFALVDELVEQLCYGAIDAESAAEMLVTRGTEIMNNR